MNVDNYTIEHIGKSSNRIAWISILGFFIIISSILYAAFSLYRLESTVEEKKAEIATLNAEVEQKKQIILDLNNRIENLFITQEDLLDFLAVVTSEEQIHLLDSSVNWNEVKKEIINFPAGKRKQAFLIAILLAWKQIPFELGQESLGGGFDSPRFLRYVLSKVGLVINDEPGIRLSATLMNSFEQVDKPQPGDLVFYRGQIGSFGFMYISAGGELGPPVGIGTLQRIAPLQIISLENINTLFFPLIGYFRVEYPDE